MRFVTEHHTVVGGRARPQAKLVRVAAETGGSVRRIVQHRPALCVRCQRRAHRHALDQQRLRIGGKAPRVRLEQRQAAVELLDRLEHVLRREQPRVAAYLFAGGRHKVPVIEQRPAQRRGPQRRGKGAALATSAEDDGEG